MPRPWIGAVVASLLPTRARADIYLHSPRGSNNKLSEQSNNVQNANRLFDSQNNAAGGYQVGDACQPVCQDADRNYNASVPGAMQGVMSFYQGSELYVEWTLQHGCGVGHPNLRCQVVLQYTTEAENPGLRDGTKRTQNTAGGGQEPPLQDDAALEDLGQHEPLGFYLNCRSRSRNKGLYTADQKVVDNRGATATRQNPNGNTANSRHGLECPEERDYYPYFHPTPWHDIVIFTDEPQVRCSYYQAESENVKGRGLCSEPAFNNPRDCAAGGGAWEQREPFNEDPPECVGGIHSRDNHLGNVRNGKPMYYLWRIPDYVRGRVVLRIRYNISTADFEAGATLAHEDMGPMQDHFFVDEHLNNRDSGAKKGAVFTGGALLSNPRADFLHIGQGQGIENDRILQLQVDTKQYGRTFEDRTHMFVVKPRPENVPESTRIVNYNIRGRRGNIVQVYPAVEYDFVPPDLVIDAGTILHFQWVGSDANAKGNAGNGRQGTDRSNLVQVGVRGETVPLPIELHTLFFDAEANPSDPEGRRLVDTFGFLGQSNIVECDPGEDDEQPTTNCKQLNGASAYFDGGLVEMTQVGEHHIGSTRNNDFSNRSQKATITILPRWEWYEILGIVSGATLGLCVVVYVGVAVYAYRRPASVCFSGRYRPRLLRILLSRRAMRRKLEERRARLGRTTAEALVEGAPAIVGRTDSQLQLRAPEADEAPTVAPAPRQAHWCSTCLRRLHGRGMREQRRLAIYAYCLLNVVVFTIGFVSHLDGGFGGSLAYPVAKGGGFMLDLNLAVVVLPTLKSLQTALRSAGATREWLPSDDPIAFHVQVATLILIGSVVHIAAHAVHILKIRSAPAMQTDPLGFWGLTAEERLSGSSLGSLFWDGGRCAPTTGVVITLLMSAMGATALPCVRRGSNRLTARLGGYNLFWRVHASWKLMYLLLLLHAPTRLWIWLFFPVVLLVVDRALDSTRHTPYVALRTAKQLPHDVISLTFEAPRGFHYEAGQYVLLGWRGEWHPFTLTSAPEERDLSLHIRAPASLDWCSALRRHLLVEAPGAVALRDAAADAALREAARDANIQSVGRESRPGVVAYEAHALPPRQLVYCTPRVLGPPAPGDDLLGDGAAADESGASLSDVVVARSPKVERSISSDSLTSVQLEEALPDEVVVLRLAGPFGAPAQKVWQFETIMAVGAGIGVTPFASILRSVQCRAKRHAAIESVRAAAAERRAARRRSPAKEGPTPSSPIATSPAAQESIQELLDTSLKVPERIYFFWIVRNQGELDWFYDLLADAMQGPARDRVHISVFITGEIELSQVKELKCTQSQYFGRPNWARIFRQTRDAHLGDHVGVFLCGSPILGQELARQAARFSAEVGGTRFSFFKEYF